MKHKIIYTLLIIIGTGLSLIGQSDDENIDKYITAVVANDTILNGNSFELKIVIRNLKGDFTPPTLNDFDIVGGPNVSTSMQFINGKTFRETTYTYYLMPRNMGNFFIEESYLDIDGQVMETKPISIFVADNPDEIRMEYRISDQSSSEFNFHSPFQTPKPKATKPKRKLKRI